MDTNLLIERFNILPDNLQIQVYDYIEFLARKLEQLFKIPIQSKNMGGD